MCSATATSKKGSMGHKQLQETSGSQLCVVIYNLVAFADTVRLRNRSADVNVSARVAATTTVAAAMQNK